MFLCTNEKILILLREIEGRCRYILGDILYELFERISFFQNKQILHEIKHTLTHKHSRYTGTIFLKDFLTCYCCYTLLFSLLISNRYFQMRFFLSFDCCDITKYYYALFFFVLHCFLLVFSFSK